MRAGDEVSRMSIEINLLPWREKQRARRSRRFYLALVLMVGWVPEEGWVSRTSIKRSSAHSNSAMPMCATR
ncbi:hypothetical protein DSL92_07410 [Billgrantia gudaonensis]|uniref:Uncharacterized protein n=1 Tax=Billgrantia gudaonensis TaxID=376427 RepID=A0A3S0QFN0_9GAMM|nr:hypothetical protein DSL92_07410 [Halomonas gudaonensis]